MNKKKNKMKCYLCGGEVETIPVTELFETSKKIINSIDTDLNDRERKFVAALMLPAMSSPYGRWRCKSCKKTLNTYELIGKNIFSVQPLPPGAASVYSTTA